MMSTVEGKSGLSTAATGSVVRLPLSLKHNPVHPVREGEVRTDHALEGQSHSVVPCQKTRHVRPEDGVDSEGE
jgi:hypothetical protein